MISIVMTIKNRAHLLARTLPGIAEAAATFGVCELVVVDDSSTDKLFLLLREHADRLVIRHIVIDNTRAEIPIAFNSPALGINIGVCRAKYDIILKTEPENFWPTNNLMAALSSFAPHKLTIGTAFRAPEDMVEDFDKTQMERVRDGLYYYIACFDKTTFLRLHGIEEAYGQGYGAEDEDFRERWARIGPVLHEPRMEVYHLHHTKPAQHGSEAHKVNLKLWHMHHTNPKRIMANEGRDWGSDRVVKADYYVH